MFTEKNNLHSGTKLLYFIKGLSSKTRSFLWPISRLESFKCLSLIVIHFFVTFNYTILKTLKDPMLVTLKESGGALIIPFAKTWAVLPAAIGAAFLFTRFLNKWGFQKTFNILISFFIAYFITYLFILHPYEQYLYIGGDSFVNFDPNTYGSFSSFMRFFKYILVLIHYWPLTSFYVISELWSSIALSVLFWGFANQITFFGEAKRFYGPINFFGNLSGILAAGTAILFNRFSQNNMFFCDCSAWSHTMYGLLIILALFTTFIFILFNIAYKNFSSGEESSDKLAKKQKKKVGMFAAFTEGKGSRYILCIALVVLAYNLSMNILEIIWKDSVLRLYPAKKANHEFMSQILLWTGVASTCISLFISSFIRVFGWSKTAYATPVLLCVTSCCFFYFYFFGYLHNELLSVWTLTPLYVLVFIGGVQNALCRSFKFSFFDATKEMAFIPLSKEQKIKAKAVIDGFGSRLGKAGGATLVQILVFILSTPLVSAMVPFFLCVLVPVIVSWFYSIFYIGKKLRQGSS